MVSYADIRAALGTPFLRRLLRRPICARPELASRFLSGQGIEVGALNAPLAVPDCATVTYVDRISPELLREAYSDVALAREPDALADLESLSGFDDASQDFVIANHVLEHVENPLRALHAISRVLGSGGIAFIALPDKRHTFDKRRRVTPLWHIIRDYEEGPDWSRRAHYLDWARNVERAKNVDIRCLELEASRMNIHFHVWDRRAMREMFEHVERVNALTIEHSRENRGEVIWILRKS